MFNFLIDVKVWDIVAELVRVCTIPAPPNPFAIDFDYYESLPVPEKLLSSGAMVNFLRRILQGEQHSYTKRGKKCFFVCLFVQNCILYTKQDHNDSYFLNFSATVLSLWISS